MSTLCLLAGSLVPTVPAMADSVKVVTLGADLTDEQKSTMLKYFKVDSSEVQILTITNQDEREHLSAYVPLEQIGTRTVSCAYVKPTTSGGIKVRTANLNWVTCNMIATSLSTSGVKNCEVVAACPFEVSGTGALTGIQMAYETASGETLDTTKKQIATEEMVVTGNLAEDVGQNAATAVVNQAKTQVIAENIQDADTIYNIVINIADDNGVALSDEQVQEIVSLLEEIAQEDYNYEDMEETLDRVNNNVTGQEDDTEDDSDDEDSILDDVDDSVLGDGVIEDSTQDTSLAEDTNNSDVIDGGDSDTDVEISEGDTGVLNSEDSSTDTGVSENTGDELSSEDVNSGTETADGEVQDIDNVSTDFLSADDAALFEQAKVFGDGEYRGNVDSLHTALGDDAAATVVLDEETGKKLYNTVLSKYLGILGNGTDSYVATGEETYFTAELNMMEKELKKIFGIDLTDEEKSAEDADILGDAVSTEDKETLYKDTMKFFEKLYNEESAETTEGTSEDTAADTTEGTDTETYSETDAETDTYTTEDEVIPEDEIAYDETVEEY